MLKQTRPRLPGEAALKYEDATFTVLRKGDFVVCAVTGKRIPLEALRYWSVDRQEAYFDVDAAVSQIREGETSR